MRDGFLKVAAATPAIRVADCAYNGTQIVALMDQAAEQGVKVICFPELCVTGYTCGDLFLQDTLLQGAEAALEDILDRTAHLDLLACVGVPVRWGCKLYNCGAVFCRGELLVENLRLDHLLSKESGRKRNIQDDSLSGTGDKFK